MSRAVLGYILFAGLAPLGHTQGMTLEEITANVAAQVRLRMAVAETDGKNLSLAAGLGETYVPDLLGGKKSKNPRVEHLTKLAAALDCTLCDLVQPLSPTEIATGRPEPGQFIKGRNVIALVRFWDSLDEPDRDSFTRLLKIDMDALATA